jgi:lipoprotein NlpI
MRHILVLILSALHCAAQPALTPLDKATAAYRQGDLNAALAILDQQIPLEPEKAELYLLRGDIHSVRGQSAEAVENYSEVVKRSPDHGAAIYRRAVEYFRLGKIKESVADFDKIAALHPDRAPQLWQRGICYYYAGAFAKGRQQFETHQTVNQQDVENAVWHFLCVAKLRDFEKAREQLIPIQEDPRVPMTQIHALFAGRAKPEDVLSAARAGGPNPEQLRDRLFYAHLYLGLYEEARGDAVASLDHMKKAAGDYAQKHYMGDVARVHVKLRANQSGENR